MLREYQPLLHLTDWKLSVVLVDQKDIGSSRARLEYCANHKEGRIFLPSRETFNQPDYVLQDMQHSLMHELVHLHFAIVDVHIEDRPNETILYEQGVNKVAETICELVGEPKVFLCQKCKCMFTDAEGTYGFESPLIPNQVFTCHKCFKGDIIENGNS